MATSEDIWEDLLFECSFGGVRADCQSTSDDSGRAIVPQVRIGGDGASIDDEGAEPRVTRLRLIFFQLAPDDNPHERFAFFFQAAQQGTVQTFIHPITGQYKGKIGEFSWSATAEERATITVDCTVHEHSDVPAVFDIGAGSPTTVGPEAVAADAGLVDDELGLVNDDLDPDGQLDDDGLIDETVETTAGWQDLVEDPDVEVGDLSRQINNDLRSLNDKLQQLIDDWDLATDVSRYQLLVALQNLHYTVGRCADTFLVTTPKTFEARVGDIEISLLQLLLKLYGSASKARDNYDAAISLNEIENPGRLDPGTTLTLPAP